jgi:phosphoribosylaminoimidazole (AIR) synthetase
MFRTFNMGVGFVLVVPEASVPKALESLPQAFVLGQVVEGSGVQYSKP